MGRGGKEVARDRLLGVGWVGGVGEGLVKYSLIFLPVCLYFVPFGVVVVLVVGWGVLGLFLVVRREAVHDSLSLESMLVELEAEMSISVMVIGERDLHFRWGCSFVGVVGVVATVEVGWFSSLLLLSVASELLLVEDVSMVVLMLPILPGCFLGGDKWVSFRGVLLKR